MKLLAFDTTGPQCSAVLCDTAASDRPLAHRTAETDRTQADAIVPVVEAVLADAGMSWDQVDVMAVCVGPGGFTSVRVGVAAARAFALATGRRVLPVTGLEAVATAALHAGGGETPVLVALDARRSQVYAQAFDADGEALAGPEAVAPGMAASNLPRPLRAAGNGAALVVRDDHDPHSIEVVSVDMDARWVAARAIRRLNSGESACDGTSIEPLYLRAPDARPQPIPLVARAGEARP